MKPSLAPDCREVGEACCWFCGCRGSSLSQKLFREAVLNLLDDCSVELSPKQSPNSRLIDADLLYGFTSADDIESGGEREGGLAGGSGEAAEAFAEQGVDLYAGGCRKTDVECAVSGIDTCGGGYGGVADGGEDVHLARG